MMGDHSVPIERPSDQAMQVRSGALRRAIIGKTTHELMGSVGTSGSALAHLQRS
jgi:hypothetical protein